MSKANDPFAENDLDFDSFDFDDVMPAGESFSASDPFAPQDETENLPKLTLESVEEELEEVIEDDIYNANQAAIDARLRYEMVDADRMQSDFFFTVVFQNSKQREEFCQKSDGLIKENEIYLDGMELAERLGITLETPFVTDGKLRKAWRRLLGMAVNPGKSRENWY